MLKVFYITFTEDKGTTYRRIAVPAESIPLAYIEVQLKFPEAEITEIEITGKTITIKEAK